MKVNQIKTYHNIACCGLDCVLCPTFYTQGPSRCPGCSGLDFFNKHPSCSIITCCVKKNGFETCAECNEFPCSRLKDWDKYDSFICHRISLSNLNLIKEKGIKEFIKQQKKRIELLEHVLKNFNEGRSKSFYCIATALVPIKDLEQALKNSEERIKKENINFNDLKTKSKILKEYLNESAKNYSLKLKLRKK